MSDLAASMAQPLLDWDALLRPIPGDHPSGQHLRNQPVYDEIRDALKPVDTAPGAVGQSERRGADFRAVVRDATKVLSERSKDLDLAVWLAEALVRSEGIYALADAVALVNRLLDTFWDTIYPLVDEDGDEGFRAKPINRLNTAFVAPLRLIEITRDGRRVEQFTIYQYNDSRDVPPEEKASNSAELARKREAALASGAPAPEEVNKAIEGTARQFYEGLAEDVKRAAEAVRELQETCGRRFRTAQDRPYFEKLSDLLEGLLNTAESLARAKPAAAMPSMPKVQAPVTESYSGAETAVSSPAPSPAPTGIPGMAAAMRNEDSSDPVPYMLLRAWRFGPMLAHGTPIDESQLEPPSTEIRTALRKAWLNTSWWDVLEIAEQAMEQPCGACWLDLQHRAYRAARELDREGIAVGVRAMVTGYLQALPDLARALMLDGSPAADAETQAWLREEVLVDRRQALKESLDEVRSVDVDEHAAVFEGKDPDPLEVAESELQSGRFSEAFRVLSEAIPREQSGRGRMQRKVQLAKICLEAGQHRLAATFLREVCRTIDEQRLDTWEPADFVAAPLGMLYRCLEALGEDNAERQRVYERLCLVHPLRALEFASS